MTAISLDSKDFRILAELLDDARISFVAIGEKLTLHPNVVAYRISRMKELGVIKGYTVILEIPPVEVKID